MAADERDRSFDKALARHLRSALPAGESAAMARVSSAHSGACPDTETLAAYHERSLFPEQMNSLKEHIVGCTHCQAILAQLETTDEISLQAFAEEEIIDTRSAPTLAARGLETSAPAAAHRQSQGASGTTPPEKSPRVLILRGARWRWLAPAGAIAAGLLVWIALHENARLAPPAQDQVQIAKSQPLPPPASTNSRARQEVVPLPKAAPENPRSEADEFAAARARVSAGAVKSHEKLDQLAHALPAKPLAGKESGLRKDTSSDSTAMVLRDEKQLDRDAKTAGVAGREEAEVQQQLQAANAQLQNQANANATKLPGPAPLGQMEAKKMKAESPAPSAPPPQPRAAGGTVAGFNGSAAMEVTRAISNPRLIASPAQGVLWRAGRSGSIDFSKDGGASWSRQSSGVLADLLTGSAPSDQVCWIVGRGGAILLTADGGAHWTAVSSPVPEDLGGIRAVDALHATIWNARNTKSFETADGGLTWKRVATP